MTYTYPSLLRISEESFDELDELTTEEIEDRMMERLDREMLSTKNGDYD